MYGQLGLGDNSTRGDSAGDMGDYLPVVAIGSGFLFRDLLLGLRYVVSIPFIISSQMMVSLPSFSVILVAPQRAVK